MKWFKTIARREKKLIHLANQVMLRSFRNAKTYQYGFQVPRNHDEAMEIDRRNKNTQWADSEKLELSQLDEYEAFKDLGKGQPLPVGYKKIRVHMIYAVKHNGRHKSCLMAGGHLTDIPVRLLSSEITTGISAPPIGITNDTP